MRNSNIWKCFEFLNKYFPNQQCTEVGSAPLIHFQKLFWNKVLNTGDPCISWFHISWSSQIRNSDSGINFVNSSQIRDFEKKKKSGKFSDFFRKISDFYFFFISFLFCPVPFFAFKITCFFFFMNLINYCNKYVVAILTTDIEYKLFISVSNT